MASEPLMTATEGRRKIWPRFAVPPAIACAIVALLLSGAAGGDVFHGVLSGIWHGGAVYVLTGLAGLLSKSRVKTAT